MMEAGRSIIRGFVTPDRTTLIASTHRALAVSEKMVPGDGIAASDEVMAAAEMAAKCALILGPDAGPRWLDTRPELAGLLVLESGALVPSRRWLPRWEPYGEATAAGETARQSHDQCKGDIQ